MFLTVPENMTLAQLNNRVSADNVAEILAVNGLDWQPHIGAALAAQVNAIQSDPTRSDVGWEQRNAILNKLSQDSDIFEQACLLGDAGWKVLVATGTFPGMVNIPASITIPQGSDTIGNGKPVPAAIYQAVMGQLAMYPHVIDPSLFNTYSSNTSSVAVTNSPDSSLFKAFHIPWGDVTLYSSASDTSLDFPVYPESIEDGVAATYTTMPDMIYQYEPWQVYHSSGPRSPRYTFHFHRDMWSGDHRDGKANELVRFCQAQCYPDYQGSAVIAPTVTLYIAGDPEITGVVTAVNVTWGGPLGLDKWYLECTLELSIIEVSTQELNNQSVAGKPLIG